MIIIIISLIMYYLTIVNDNNIISTDPEAAMEARAVMDEAADEARDIKVQGDKDVL